MRSISDPEHPLTLEQLAVVNAQHITVDEGDAAKGRLPTVLLEFTPTIPHCSMATLIGECSWPARDERLCCLCDAGHDGQAGTHMRYALGDKLADSRLSRSGAPSAVAPCTAAAIQG